MPLIVGNRLLSNREPLAKMTMAELKAYENALEGFMRSNSSMIAITLKQVYQEIEWRNAAHSKKQARPRRVG
jgi:alkyl hydroperoxide reductase subunit AhpC